jgi:iron complex transport system substrate-binding protein
MTLGMKRSREKTSLALRTRAGYIRRVRVVTLLPAATEIVAALGMLDHLVAVSHECDWPPAVAAKPRATNCPIHDAGLPSRDVDRWVSDALASRGTLYTMDEPLLRRLAPDVIVTQRLCDVCAVDYESVTALAATLPGPPRVVNLDPATLGEIMDDVRRVGEALGVAERATAVVTELEARIDAVRRRAAGAPRRRCVLLEWIDPLYRTGHWGPELVEIAGGTEPLARRGEDATRLEWEELVAAAPEAIVVACCGYSVARARADLPLLTAHPGWAELPAVRAGAVWVVDGSAYFSRPGPRIVDSLELLATLLHPERFGGSYPELGAVRVGVAES